MDIADIIMYFVLFVVVIIGIVFITVSLIYHQHSKFYFYSFPGIAKVLKKECNKEYVQKRGLVKTKESVVSQYTIYCEYDNNLYSINSESLYCSKNKGDLIDVMVHSGSNWFGEKCIYITLNE